MTFLELNGAVLHTRFRAGRDDVTPILFLNSLGTDFRIWDEVIARLPGDIPVAQIDKRGHGLSEATPATVKTFADDGAALLAHHGLGPALVCGVSIGGLIAQRIALDHPARVKGLVLSNTGARLGDVAMWQARIDAAKSGGLEAMADGVMERWFSPTFRKEQATAVRGYRMMMSHTTVEGYVNACAALRDADHREEVGRIAVPTLCVSGTEDQATPPALVEDLADRIPNAKVLQLDGIGHLPSIETPDRFASYLKVHHEAL